MRKGLQVVQPWESLAVFTQYLFQEAFQRFMYDPRASDNYMIRNGGRGVMWREAMREHLHCSAKNSCRVHSSENTTKLCRKTYFMQDHEHIMFLSQGGQVKGLEATAALGPKKVRLLSMLI